jgi:hypothetical protein
MFCLYFFAENKSEEEAYKLKPVRIALMKSFSRDRNKDIIYVSESLYSDRDFEARRYVYMLSKCATLWKVIGYKFQQEADLLFC